MSPSRSSTASCAPVDAPEGTIAVPREPSVRMTSTATVGSPRESRISRPRIISIVVSGITSLHALPVRDRGYAGQRLTFDELQRGAAPGRDMRHPVGEAELLHRLHRF